jgi:hypothetical protein
MLRSGTRCEGFFAVLKRGLLLKESLEEDIDILFSLTVNGIAYGVVRGWEGCEELLEHLRLIKRVLYGRVNGLNHSR